MSDVQGLQNALAKLGQLEDKIAKQYVKDGLTVGAKIVAAETFRRAPVRTGTLRDAIKVKSSRFNRQGKISVLVSIGAGWFKGPTFYAGFVALGHFVGSRRLGPNRTKVEPDKFIQEATDASRDAATDAAMTRIVNLIENGK